MRLRIHHETAYTYEVPATRAIQILRLTPRGHNGQFIVNWRIDVDRDCRLNSVTDAFGNSVHSFTVDGPLDSLTVTAVGEVETQETHGILSGQVERFPPSVFLRETPLTAPDEAIRTLALRVADGSGPNRLNILHNLMEAIRDNVAFETDRTDAGTSAIEAFSAGRGVCQDFSHIFIAATRHLGIPARYVGGYLFQPDAIEQEAGHAWAEALVDNLGWVGFDPTNGVSPTDAYVRVAVGLDGLGASPVRGTHYGGAGESLSVRIRVERTRQPAR